MILLKINEEGTSPSLRSVRSPKPQIFVEMFCRNLQSSVWKRHVGAVCWCTSDVHQYGVFILGSVNFCETFRRIFAVWENAQTLNSEKCLLHLFSIGSKFLDFIHWMVFDLFFYCVTVKTIYSILARRNWKIFFPSGEFTCDYF